MLRVHYTHYLSISVRLFVCIESTVNEGFKLTHTKKNERWIQCCLFYFILLCIHFMQVFFIFIFGFYLVNSPAIVPEPCCSPSGGPYLSTVACTLRERFEVFPGGLLILRSKGTTDRMLFLFFLTFYIFFNLLFTFFDFLSFFLVCLGKHIHSLLFAASRRTAELKYREFYSQLRCLGLENSLLSGPRPGTW